MRKKDLRDMTEAERDEDEREELDWLEKKSWEKLTLRQKTARVGVRNYYEHQDGLDNLGYLDRK